MNKTKQKTWADLLGKDAANCKVEGNYIVRCDGDRRKILWTFPNNMQAETSFHVWINGLVNANLWK